MHPQVFNQLNSRKIKDEYNVFDGLIESRSFIYISVVEVVLQVRGAGSVAAAPVLHLYSSP